MKISFDLSRNQVTIEGDGPDLTSLLQAIREVAPKVSEIRLITNASPSSSREELAGKDGNGQQLGGNKSIHTMREFARAMAPTNISERIVAIGAFLKRYQNQGDFSPKEMGEFFTICGFEKPAQMPVAIFDAKRKYGYLEKSTYGRWRLSTSGENLVTRKLNENGGAS